MGRDVVIKRSKVWETLRRLGATQKTVVVGVIGRKGDEQHKDSPPGTTVAQVAQWNHFGTGTIPARPFLTLAMEQHKSEIARIQRRLAQGLLEEKLTLDQALGLLGETAVGFVKQTIADGVPPPNAPSTVAAKGSDKPLINFGQLRGSISSAVRDGAGDGH